jgi:hypothetical protein
MYVYLIRCSENSYYKIGISKNVERRLKQIQTSSPDEVYLIHKYESKYASRIEKALHNFFISYHRNNEWFELSLNEEINFLEMCSSIEKNLIYLEENKIGI